MFHNNSNEAVPATGIPYNDIKWYDVSGQPFGTASGFNAIVFGDANNIVDTKGAMAIAGNFVSPRGLTLGFGNNSKMQGTGYSPGLVRFLVGNSVTMQGPLVVAGHVVAGRNFQAANGSTYMIGKDGTNNQVETLTRLYQADNGSRYWRVSDHGDHYVISSYDVPRYIPARRINADVTTFFNAAKESITNFQRCIVNLQPNGTVTEHYHEWILRGNDPKQNVFRIDARPNGLLNKDIRFEIPEGSLGIVILQTGPHAHLQSGLWGSKAMADHTLYVFEDAEHIHMEIPAAIWGSILAPQAMFHAHQTGGTVSGNAALGAFAVSAASGFEFHLFPFVGGVVCAAAVPQPAPQPAPQPVPMPARRSASRPVPPQAPRVPEQQPVSCPECPPCPTCEKARICPPCPEAVTNIVLEPVPIPVPFPYEKETCGEACLVEPGVIFGCIWGCSCCKNHEWEVTLYKGCKEDKTKIGCSKLSCCGCFEFRVPYDDYYLLIICPVGRGTNASCKPVLTLKNVGVVSLMIG